MRIFLICVVLVGLTVAKTRLGLGQPIYDHINSLQSTWKAGHNSRWDSYTIESLYTQAATIEDDLNEAQLPMKEIEVILQLPTNFDSRKKWPNCESIREIRDQSKCGSCWAFGAATAMSDRICIASGQTLQTRVSPEDILSCCTTCGNGCNGGRAKDVWEYFVSDGVVTGDDYLNYKWCRAYSFPPCDHHSSGKYPICQEERFQTPECKNQCHDQSGRQYTSDKIRASEAFSIPKNVMQIKTEIYNNGPIGVSMHVYEDFFAYKSGIYQHVTGERTGSHSVRLIGWGVEDGVPYWLCANTWNESWGDNGFFKILRGQNHCNIEAKAVAGIPAL